LVKEALKHHNTAGMQGFAFNLRRPMFQHRDVRHALALALDFDWMNTTLFYGQYTANDSFFDNSELAATGLPSPAELALLEPLRQQLPPAVFTEPMGGAGKRYDTVRERLRAAKQLLTQAGWQVRDGVLTEVASGQQMRFTITLVSPAFQRIVEPYTVNLSKLGIQANMKVVDESIYERLIRTHDFDMVVQSFGQSQSPGNEQRDYWHSEAADVEGSRNIIGMKNPAVDALVEAVIVAPTRQELVTATHALDRVLWYEHYVVPHWFIDSHRLTYWNKFSYAKTLPLYYSPLSHLMYWWVDTDKEQELTAAMAANRGVSLGP
jgi:microcin C transport system substrate-binding protein